MMDNGLRIVQGNTFATAIEIHAVDATGQPIVDWSLQDSTDLRVWYVFAGREQDITTWQIDDGKLVIVWLANMQRVGTYDIFCAGKYNGADWRNAMQYQFSIVRFNHEANIPANVVILDGVYQLSAELQIITQFAGGGGGTPSQTLPLMDGEASVGTETAYARGDHRHPSDTSKQDVIADLATIRSGAAAGATAYQKPSGGIPKTDLASAVQTSLGKADTALQQSNIVDSLNSQSTTAALSANQGKVLNDSKQATIDASHKLSADLVDDTSTTNKFVTSSEKSTWNGKQDAISDLATIRSGAALGATSVQSVKTINGNTMTGTGNVSTMTPVTNHGTSDTTFAVTPNILHIWGTVASLTLTLATPTDNTIVNEYMIEFTSGSTATTLSLPSSVEWAESCGSLSVEASKTYQISIVNNIGLWTAISNS